MLKPHECFKYSLAQRGAAQTLYLATNNARAYIHHSTIYKTNCNSRNACSQYIYPVQRTSDIQKSQTYSDGNEWEEATQRELQQFDDLEAMLPIRLEEVPEDANITKSKTVYKLKLLRNGDVEKCKARIVAKGYTQEYGVQYTNLFLQHHKYLECVLC